MTDGWECSSGHAGGLKRGLGVTCILVWDQTFLIVSVAGASVRKNSKRRGKCK